MFSFQSKASPHENSSSRRHKVGRSSTAASPCGNSSPKRHKAGRSIMVGQRACKERLASNWIKDLVVHKALSTAVAASMMVQLTQ